ncbi:MAG: signal peptidase I [Syntrophobacteraceae bacterium]
MAATGLGHIYCGRLVKGLILFFASFAFGPIIVAAANGASSNLMLAIVIGSLGLMFAIFVYAVVDSSLLARKLRTYQLKEYNRWYLYVLLVVVAAGYPTNFAHSIRANVLQAFKVPSSSMSPGILPGDHVLLNKAIYKKKAPQHSDVVIFTYPDDRRLNYVKRIVALPGDTVEMRDNVLLVNDLPLDRPLAPASAWDFKTDDTQSVLMEENAAAAYPIIVDSARPQNVAKITVPHGYCFVLGDNRSHSIDSRNFGPVQLNDIQGRLDYIYWPAKSWSRLGLYPPK